MKFGLFFVATIFLNALTVSSEDDPVKGAIVNDAGTQETTQFGAKINNTDSLTGGRRGPTLLEDFMLREKIMHFGKYSKNGFNFLSYIYFLTNRFICILIKLRTFRS